MAPVAFYRLNTPRSLEAMADLVRSTEAGSWVHLQSAKFLALTGDPTWLPLLLENAQKHANIADYVTSAAESNGEKMLPTLATMLQNPDRETIQANAISALGYTGSRAAVPALLDLFRSPDDWTSLRALYA
jgi:HEAT repeat protein